MNAKASELCPPKENAQTLEGIAFSIDHWNNHK